MKQTKLRIITIILSIIIAMNIFSLDSYAAGSFAVNASKKSLTVGETTNLLISAINSAGKFSISSSNTSVVTVSSSSVFVDGNSMDPNITITAKGAGSATITITAVDVESYDDTPQAITGSKTVNINVSEKSSAGTTSDQNQSTNTTNTTNNTTEEPKFKTVNEKVYVKNTANVRTSYSTSSTKLGQLNIGDSITRTGIGDNGWSKVTYNGKTGYVSTSLLTTEEPKPEEPEEPANEEQPDENEEEPEEGEEAEQVILGLEKLEIANYTLNPEFSADRYEYTLEVKEDINSLDIEAIANIEGAEVEILGNEGFVIGENNITILVTNADEDETLTYTIKVNKVIPESNNNLIKIIVIGVIGVFVLILFLVMKFTNKDNYDDYDKVPLVSMLEDEEINSNIENNIKNEDASIENKENAYNTINNSYDNLYNRRTNQIISDVNDEKDSINKYESYAFRRRKHFADDEEIEYNKNGNILEEIYNKKGNIVDNEKETYNRNNNIIENETNELNKTENKIIDEDNIYSRNYNSLRSTGKRTEKKGKHF